LAPATLAVTLPVLLLSGCGASATPSETVASRFTGAVAASDWDTGCSLLAPGTKAELEESAGTACPEALSEADLPDAGRVRESSAFGTMAQVRYDRDTVFVAEFRSGWKVMAAGCTPVPGHPYDCELKG
jgi:hypothetical protein